MNQISDGEKQNILADHLAGMMLIPLAEKYHHDHKAIKRILNEFESYIDRSYLKGKRKYTWNFQFFDQNSSDTAYWAGYIFADGCLRQYRPHSYRVHIIIKNSDVDHLRKFTHAIGISETYLHQNSRTSTVQIQHKNLGPSLLRWGIVERKSYNFLEPQVPQILLPHFLRGWFDGDGHSTYERFHLVGNFMAISWYANQLRDMGFDKHISLKQQPGKVWGRLLVTGKFQVSQISELLLVKDHIRLERKWKPILGY